MNSESEKFNLKLNNENKFDLYLSNFKLQNYFSYVKLNHAFWEYVCGDLEIYRTWNVLDLAEEVNSYLPTINCDSQLYVAVGIGGYDKAIHDHENIIKSIKSRLPHCLELHSATVFKKAFIMNGFKAFIETLKDKKIIVIGLSHLKNIDTLWGLSSCHHYCIKIDEAQRRDKLLLDLLNFHEQGTIYFFQCGELLGFWLIYNLHKKVTDGFFIDLGRALDFKIDQIEVDAHDDLIYKKMTGKSLRDFLNYQPWKKEKNWSTTFKLL